MQGVLDPGQIARLYRALRKDSKDEAGAANFSYGERWSGNRGQVNRRAVISRLADAAPAAETSVTVSRDAATFMLVPDRTFRV